jgi:hypothetical protein
MFSGNPMRERSGLSASAMRCGTSGVDDGIAGGELEDGRIRGSGLRRMLMMQVGLGWDGSVA